MPKSSLNRQGYKMKRLETKSALHRRLEDDVLMASQVGDAVWLQQSLETTKLSLGVANNDGLLAIHLAALECQLDCLKILITKMNADVNSRSLDGWTPLHLAINNSSPRKSFACVSYLLSLGADPSSETDFGITPMHQAAACGNLPCLKSLIEANGLIDGTDARGHTPYSLAELWSYRDCARILKHFQWEKDKKSEDKLKRKILKDEQEQAIAEDEQKKKEKIERRLKGQKAYQLWLSKNQFAEMPMLFGQEPIDETDDESKIAHRGASRQNLLSSKGQKPKKSVVSKPEQTSSVPKGSSKKIDLIPIAGPGSPTPGRRFNIDFDKRSQNLGLAKTKTVQKRGPLQFPVI